MKKIIITGASTGIGAATALDLAKRGHQVFACVRKTQDGERLLSLNNTISILEMDVTREDSIQQSFEIFSKDKKNHEVVLINNAGIAVSGPVESVSLNDFRKQFEVNFFGLIAVTQKFLPLIRKTRGRVINVSSIAGRVASPFLGPYAASKFAVEGLNDSLRREMIPFGVQVVLIEPGPIQTPIWEKGLGQKDAIRGALAADQIEVYGSYIDLFQEAVEKIVSTAEPVERVLEAMREAVESESPQHRYLVGKEAQLSGFLSSILPSRWLDVAIKKRVFKKSIFNR
jgi:NAD(P)-dependent dehydrogenase (short-subunit alcohol dehydrogenase family)